MLPMTEKYNIIIEIGEDDYFISEVLELAGCHTQVQTLDELMRRTKEAISLYLEMVKPIKIKTKFLGFQQIEV